MTESESESEHEAKARDFVDSILEVNRQHGVDQESAVIDYEVAVEAAVRTFKPLRDNVADTSTGEHQSGEEVPSNG
jgi:hypothetical protein